MSVANPSAKHTLAELDTIYRESDTVDSKPFAEMRSNLLIISGDHYNRHRFALYERLRRESGVPEETRLRLVKNHTQYITGMTEDNILSAAPDVGFSPQHDRELQDQKKAELHHAVWLDAKYRYRLDERKTDWVKDYVRIGEVVTKIFWDPDGGKVVAYQQKVDDDGAPLFIGMQGELTLDDGSSVGMQHPMAPDWNAPVFEGAFVFEKVYGFNLLRPSECTDIRDAEQLTIRKMIDKDLLLKKYPEHAKIINPTENKTFKVFDGTTYRQQSAKEVLVREFWFKPCYKYPRGYYFITTLDGILDEGELPGGIFPIVYQAYETAQTSPRGYGPVRALRPYQMEINRTASKIAEHQMTVGDDKLVTTEGAKVSSGIKIPGIRHVTIRGGYEAKYFAGRDGGQFFPHMQSQIQEMYQIAGFKEELEEMPAQLDPMVLLARAARQKKRFSRHIAGFERFFIQVAQTFLALAKVHYPDDMVIRAIGRSEIVNMPEFKSSDDLGYEIHVEAQSEDVETKLGRQLALNNAIQYLGNKLEREDIGKILRNMPYANIEGAFDEFTMDSDQVTNEILSLDRGDQPPISYYANHDYAIKRLTFRMGQPDFNYLDGRIRQNYQKKLAIHEQMKAFQIQQVQRMEQGIIPTGGYLATVDLYVPDPADPTKQRRLRIWSNSLNWLLQQLQAQGTALDSIEEMSTGAKADIAGQVLSLQSQYMPQPSPAMPGMNPPAGYAPAS